MIKNQYEQDLFEKLLNYYDTFYDEKEKMLTQYLGDHNYHTTLSNQIVHPTHNSLLYAFELMNSGKQSNFDRAKDILYKVVPLQDTNPEHKTYGIWSWFYDEPLEKMSPPDWNWADFCGKDLLQIVLVHGKKLPAELLEMLKSSITHACNAIVIRNMDPGYTNISIMGTFVTLIAGEYFHNQELFQYAKNRLKELYHFNMSHGAFKEYNSPTYTVVAAGDLARLICYVQDKECLQMVEELNELIWECIARHFHYRTSQWAGPHSRSYTMLQDTGFLNAVEKKEALNGISKEHVTKMGTGLLEQMERALNYQVQLAPKNQENLEKLLPMDFFSMDLKCPEKYKSYFTQPNREDEVNIAYMPGNDQNKKEIAVSYLSEKYTLASFYCSDYWNQKRAFLSYFGTAQKPNYLAVKCLHDFYDYSSGMVVTAQKKGMAAAVVNFSTNGGDTHPNLDMVKNAAILASDLRLRFEIGGAAENVQLEKLADGKSFIGIAADVKFKVAFPYAKFGSNTVRYETGKDGDIQYIDAIFYSGEKTSICFTDLDESVCAFTFEISDDMQCDLDSKVECDLQDNYITVTLKDTVKAGGERKACTFKQFYQSARAYVEGKEYQELY